MSLQWVATDRISPLTVPALQKNFARVCLFLLTCALAGAVMPQAVKGATCTTTSDGVWNKAANWDCSFIPGSGDTAVIVNTIRIGENTTVGTVKINSPGVLTPTAPISSSSQQTLTVESDLSVNYQGSSTELAGYVTFDPNKSQLGLDVTGSITNDGDIDFSAAPDVVFESDGNFTNNSTGIANLGGQGLTVGGDLTNSGDFQANGNPVSIGGKLDNNDGGLVKGGGATITVNTFSNDEDIELDSGTLDAASFATSGTNNLAARLATGTSGVIEVGGDFTNGQDGTLSISSGTIRLAADFTNNGAFQKNSDATAVFNGLGDDAFQQSLKGSFFDTNAFANFTVRQDADVDPGNSLTDDDATSGDPVQIDGDLTIESGAQYGTGDASTRDNTEAADLIYNGDQFAITGTLFSSKVTFSGPSTTSIQGAVFAEVRVAQNTTVQLGENFALLGLLGVNNEGELDVNGKRLVLEGDVQIVGDLTTTSGGTIRFRGGRRETCCSGSDLGGGPDQTQQVIGSANIEFPGLQVEDSTSTSNDIDGNTLNDDGNNTPDTVVDFIGTSGININGDFRIDEAIVRDERPFTVQGNVTVQNSGDLRFRNNARLTFFGSSNQSVTAPSGLSVSAAELDKSSNTVTVNDPITVRDTLALTQGTLDPLGNLTLANNGVVKYNGGGSIASDIIARRTLNQNENWYAISPPQPGVTYKEFEETGPNDIFTSGNPEADNTQASSGSVTIYDETVTGTKGKGYQYPDLTTEPTDPSQGVSQGAFYYVYNDDTPFDNSEDGSAGFPKTMASPGVPRTNTSFTWSSLTYTDSGGDPVEENGWNLISVPYMAEVDWDDFNFGDECIDNVVYVQSPTSGGTNNYTGLSYSAVGSTGSTDFQEHGYIDPFQSFWVKLECSPSTDLQISDITTAQVTDKDRNSDGALNDDAFIGKSADGSEAGLVRLVMELDTLGASTQFGFHRSGTVKKDVWDAYEVQFRSPSGNPPRLDLHSVLDNGTGLSINVLPDQFDDEKSFPVAAAAKGCVNGSSFGGEATMTWPALRNLPDEWGVSLKDTDTGESVSLRDTTAYTFQLESSACSKAATTAKSSNASTGERPPVPKPSVVKKPVSKDASPDTRFQLVVNPNAGTLPVELTDFTAETDQQAAVLNWSTASEQNNAGFYVQRKTEGGSFTALDGSFVEGAGTASSTTEYSYRVEDLDAGTHTFRLKQVDTDGSTSFSDPVDVKVGLSTQYKLKTYPNPVRTQATVEFAVKEQADVTIALYNTLGQKVRTVYRGTPPAEETKRAQVDTQNLSSGVYFLRLQGEGVTGTQRMTVVK